MPAGEKEKVEDRFWTEYTTRVPHPPGTLPQRRDWIGWKIFDARDSGGVLARDSQLCRVSPRFLDLLAIFDFPTFQPPPVTEIRDEAVQK